MQKHFFVLSHTVHTFYSQTGPPSESQPRFLCIIRTQCSESNYINSHKKELTMVQRTNENSIRGLNKSLTLTSGMFFRED